MQRMPQASVSHTTPIHYWLFRIKAYVLLDNGHTNTPATGKPSWRSLITELIECSCLATEALHACMFTRCAFPIAAVTAQTTATISEPDRFKIYYSLKVMVSYNKLEKKEQNLENKSPSKDCRKERRVINGRLQNHKSSLMFLSDQQALIYLLAVARCDW